MLDAALGQGEEMSCVVTNIHSGCVATSGCEGARGGRHVGALLLPRPWWGIVVVGRRIDDVRLTGSSPQHDAQECGQTSSVSHSDALPFGGLGRERPLTRRRQKPCSNLPEADVPPCCLGFRG